MLKYLRIAIIFISILFPANVHALQGLTLSNLQVEFWPEYDQPSVLVIYRITLPPTTPLPVTLSFQIPMSAGEPNAVASKQMDEKLINIDYDRKVEGDWATITFTATTPESRLEYYDPNIKKDGNTRTYNYRWTGDYAIEMLQIRVQQPFDATAMHLPSTFGSGRQGGDGLTYYLADIGTVTQGQIIDVPVEYQKPGDALSAERLQVQPSAPIPNTEATDGLFRQYLPWILGLMGLLLIAGGILWYWQTGKKSTLAPKPRRRIRTVQRPAEGTPAVEAIYCHQCGKRASSGDVFCRSCGTRLRAE